jgi:hypothetical protein
MTNLQNYRCYSNSLIIECTDLCDQMGYNALSIGPFLTFMFTSTCVILIYVVVFYLLRKNRVLERETVAIQCDMEFPLQQILIHPDNTLHFLCEEEM